MGDSNALGGWIMESPLLCSYKQAAACHFPLPKHRDKYLFRVIMNLILFFGMVKEVVCNHLSSWLMCTGSSLSVWFITSVELINFVACRSVVFPKNNKQATPISENQTQFSEECEKCLVMFHKWEVARIPFANTTALYSSLLPAGNINTWQTFHCSISKAFCCSLRTALSFLPSFSFAAYRFKERNTFVFVSCWQPIKASPLFSLDNYQSDAELWWHF